MSRRTTRRLHVRIEVSKHRTHQTTCVSFANVALPVLDLVAQVKKSKPRSARGQAGHWGDRGAFPSFAQLAVSRISVLNQVPMSSKLSPLIDAASVGVAAAPLTMV